MVEGLISTTLTLFELIKFGIMEFKQSTPGPKALQMSSDRYLDIDIHEETDIKCSKKF